MLNSARRNILVALLASLSIMLMAKGRGRNDYFYSRWMVFSTEQLMDKARFCLQNPEKRDSAMVWYTIVANRFDPKKQNPKDNDYSIGALNNLGYMYFYFYYDYQKSYSYLTKALEMSKKYGYEQNLPYIYLNMGNLFCIGKSNYAASPLNDKALAFFKKSFAEALKHKTWDVVCISINNMVSQAYSTQQIGTIEKELDQFSKARIPQNTPLLAYSQHVAKALQLTCNKHYDQALRHCDIAKSKIDDKYMSERYILSLTFIKAHIHILAGHKHEAISLLNEVQHMAEAKGMKDWLVDIYHEYSIYYKQRGDEGLYRKYRMLYLETQDSILTENKLQTVNDMQFLDELKAADERVTEAVRRCQQQAIAMWAALGVLIVVGIMLVLLWTAYSRLRQKNRRLYEKSVDMMRRFEAEREERKLMAAALQQAHNAQDDIISSSAEVPANVTQHSETSTKQTMVDHVTASLLMERIKGVMDNVEVITNQEFSVKRLSELVGEKYWIVSQVINDRYGNNFNAMLAEYRINEACRRLSDSEHYGQLTIEAIAQSLGFKSRSNFAATFKRITGLTPSEFKKMTKTA